MILVNFLLGHNIYKINAKGLGIMSSNFHEELKKRLRVEKDQLNKLMQRQEDIKSFYEEYLQLASELERRQKLIDSIEVVLQELPLEPATQPKKAKAKQEKSELPIEAIMDYVFNLLKEYPNGLKNKDILSAISAGLKIQVKGQKFFRDLAKDNRFAKVNKNVWKVSEPA
jgi:hypothetical protein